MVDQNVAQPPFQAKARKAKKALEEAAKQADAAEVEKTEHKKQQVP